MFYLEKFKLFFYQKQFNLDQQKDILTKLYSFLNSGIAPRESLESMLEIYTLEKQVPYSMVVSSMLENINSGRPMMEKLDGWFSYEVCHILCLLEQRGALKEGIKNIINYTSISSGSLKIIFSLLPSILKLLVVLLIISFVAVSLFPRFDTLIKDFPYISILLREFGNFLYANGIWILVFLVILCLFVKHSLRYYSSRWYQIIARPFLSTYKLYLSLLFFQSLSIFILNKIALSDALKLLLINQPKGLIKVYLSEMVDRLEMGDSMGEVLSSDLFTKNQSISLRILGKHALEGQYADVFKEMSEDSARLLRKKLTRITAIFKTIFMGMTALGILWVFNAVWLLTTAIH